MLHAKLPEMRKLASIQRITAIDPIEGADAIEVASVLGWKVVVKRGEFQVGDLAVYMEIDSVPPDEPEYRFLWKNTEMRPNNFRIKTVKLRGQISQGILFPMTVVHEGGLTAFCGQEGDDMTEVLNVTKYEAPLPRGGADIAGQFFDGVPKTDEERVQSETGQRLLRNLWNRPYYITTKCDGASMTVAMHDGQPKVASRNYRLAHNPDSPYWRAAYNEGENGLTLLDFVESHPNLAVQGELVGPGVQNNRLGLVVPMCLVFTIYDRDLGVRLSLTEMQECAADWFWLVPLLEWDSAFNYDQDDLLRMAEGKYEGTKNEREGIVIRSVDPFDSISFKAISNRFLLKGGE